MLPVELLREIVSLHFEICTPADNKSTSLSFRDSTSLKPDWEAVQPLSLVSKVVRRITLEAWFHVFHVHDTQYSGDLSPIPDVAFWTRTVHWTAPLCLQALYSGTFRSLRKLRYDMNGGLLSRHRLHVILPMLVEFEMRYHMWPGPILVETIAPAFPHLRVLELHQETTWCSLCHLCASLLASEAPPPKIVYTNGDGLPILYNRALASLGHLRTVRLSVSFTLDVRGASLQNLKAPWRGECGECAAYMLTDEAFVDDWEAKNRDQSRPPSLCEVVWTFTPKSTVSAESIFDDSSEEGDDTDVTDSSDERNDDANRDETNASDVKHDGGGGDDG